MKIKLQINRKYLLLFSLAALLSPVSCHRESISMPEIKGIYGNPRPFWEKDVQLTDLGVNAIFVHGGSIDREMMQKARSEDLLVFAEFATLNGKNYVEKHPEAWAINEKGEKVEAAGWFMGVCPTEPGFRKYRFDQLRELITTYDLDGVWMDYVHWHAQFEEPEPILPETCFCDHCLSAFSQESGAEIPDGSTAEKADWILRTQDKQWREWRARVVYDWSLEMRKILKEHNPDALLGLYHCPWDDQEFEGASYRILGLDYDLLRETIDVFSPMVYHGRMGREASWVEENILWFGKKLKIRESGYPKLWPIVQAYNDPQRISSEEFETVLKGGMAGKSSGVMMFTTYAVAEDEGKTEVMKNVYTEK
jgi:hypothetical protein